MNVQKKATQGLLNEFVITIPQEDINASAKKWLENRAQTFKMDGFRPGKVPLNIVEKHYGEQARQDSIYTLVNKKTQEIIKENNLKPAIDPIFDIVKDDEKEGMVLDLTIETYPEIEIKDFKNIKIDRIVHQVESSALEEDLESLRQAIPDYQEAKKGSKAEKGDRVTLSLETLVDGNKADDYSAKEFRVILGQSGMIFPELEQALEGKKVGDTLEVESKLPANLKDKKFAGKPVSLKAEVLSLENSAPSELNDELGKKIGYKDLQELKEARKEIHQNQRDKLVRFYNKRKMLDALADQYTFDVPSKLVAQEFSSIWARLKAELDLARQNGTITKEDEEKPEEELKKEYEAIATRRVRLGLLIIEIAEKNKIKASTETLRRIIDEEASRYPGQEMAVYDYYKNNPKALEAVRTQALEEEVVEHIFGEATVKEKNVDFAALKKLLGEVMPGFDEEEGNKASNEEKSKSKPKASKKKAD